MSLQVTPDLLQAAAGNLADIHSTLTAASATAAASTIGVAAAALDEVSAAVTEFFNSYGQNFEARSAAAHAFLADFAGTTANSASFYSDAESQISSLLQCLRSSVESGGANGLTAAETLLALFFPAPAGRGGGSLTIEAELRYAERQSNSGGGA